MVPNFFQGCPSYLVRHWTPPFWTHSYVCFVHLSPQPLDTFFGVANHLLNLCQEGISQISGWISSLPGGPVFSQEVIQNGREGFMTSEDHVSQPWDAQEYWQCIKNL